MAGNMGGNLSRCIETFILMDKRVLILYDADVIIIAIFAKFIFDIL